MQAPRTQLLVILAVLVLKGVTTDVVQEVMRAEVQKLSLVLPSVLRCLGGGQRGVGWGKGTHWLLSGM